MGYKDTLNPARLTSAWHPTPPETNILVCGCYRSGTSVISRMLSGHPRLFISNEMLGYQVDHFFNHKVKIAANGWRPGLFGAMNLPEEDYEAFIQELKPQAGTITKPEFVELLRRHTNKPEAMYGDKLPEYTLYLPELNKILGRPKVVMCLRDARDVISSQIRGFDNMTANGMSRDEIIGSHFWCRDTVEECTAIKQYSWLHYMQAWNSAKKDLDYYELCYGDLIGDLEREAAGVAQFFGIEEGPMILAFQEKFRPIRRKTWGQETPDMTKRLPAEWIDMLQRYGFEV